MAETGSLYSLVHVILTSLGSMALIADCHGALSFPFTLLPAIDPDPSIPSQTSRPYVTLPITQTALTSTSILSPAYYYRRLQSSSHVRCSLYDVPGTTQPS
ncbi:hypothetical protein BDU57DRAFT_510771 [Ampelomyces quisqualis]|uniref:Uncharacterized protein n=1 Tax=Ampelomyces quisqualis TaxID=50730 RepID=A0A6A5R4U1_AMPQU|nr:hypothetical protein BDU57DRAFT_510771 [Ampelomyces quisqualis]